MRELSAKLGWLAIGLLFLGVGLPYSWWIWVSGAGLITLLASLAVAMIYSHRRLKELEKQS